MEAVGGSGVSGGGSGLRLRRVADPGLRIGPDTVGIPDLEVVAEAAEIEGRDWDWEDSELAAVRPGDQRKGETGKTHIRTNTDYGQRLTRT